MNRNYKGYLIKVKKATGEENKSKSLVYIQKNEFSYDIGLMTCLIEFPALEKMAKELINGMVESSGDEE